MTFKKVQPEGILPKLGTKFHGEGLRNFTKDPRLWYFKRNNYH